MPPVLQSVYNCTFVACIVYTYHSLVSIQTRNSQSIFWGTDLTPLEKFLAKIHICLHCSFFARYHSNRFIVYNMWSVFFLKDFLGYPDLQNRVTIK